MEQQSIDLLLTDIVMPRGSDDVELARQARQRWARVKVVFTSGFPEARFNGDAASLSPGTPLLGKPYRREDLACAVRNALDA
jgi:two-component SAPR family response regulator